MVKTLLVFVACAATMGLACATARTDEVTTLPVPTPQTERTRVIAHLRVATAHTDAEKRVAIAQAREGLLKDLAKSPYRVTRVYDSIPFLALELSREALRLAEQSVWVERIDPDSVSAPQ